MCPKEFKKAKINSIWENNRRGFVTLSDHCGVVGIFCAFTKTDGLMSYHVMINRPLWIVALWAFAQSFLSFWVHNYAYLLSCFCHLQFTNLPKLSSYSRLGTRFPRSGTLWSSCIKAQAPSNSRSSWPLDSLDARPSSGTLGKCLEAAEPRLLFRWPRPFLEVVGVLDCWAEPEVTIWGCLFPAEVEVTRSGKSRLRLSRSLESEAMFPVEKFSKEDLNMYPK